VQVRVARAGDLTQAGALTAEAYHADRLLDEDDGYEVELRDAERRAHEAVLLVAVTGDVVIGALTLAPYGSSYAEVAGPGEVELRMLAVAPEARRRGVAERLVVAALREAVARGTRRVVLSTLDSMPTAHRLYRRLGFVAAPERDWGHEGVALRVLTWRAPDAPGALVEAATWVPARSRVVDGWRVGISGGFTRRANSVLPIGAPVGAAPDAVGAAALEDAVARTSAVLVEAGLPPVFRICTGSPAGLDAVLDGLGFAVAATTDVLVRDLGAPDVGAGSLAGTRDVGAQPHTVGTDDDGERARPHASGAPGPGTPDLGPQPQQIPGGPPAAPAHLRVGIADAPDEAWLDGWLAVKAASGGVDRETARAVVTGSRALYLTAVDVSARERVVGVLRAALAEDWVGLSCLMVAPDARRRGIGRLLTERALAAAAERGARRAFLQVEVENAGAATLYAQQGFRPAERYHYRER
jgi:ribosomal protein S18 acetylase RimI-like enzyme